MNTLKLIDYFKGNADTKEKLRMTLVLIYAFSLPFNLFYSSLIFITLCVVTLIDINKSKFRTIPKQFWIFQGIFLLSVSGYLFSLHKNAAGAYLERQLTIFLFPIILPLAINIDSKKVKLILSALTLSCLVSVCYLFTHMIVTIRYDLHLPVFKTALSDAFFHHQFSKPLDIHAGYLSLYVALSAVYLATLINKSNSWSVKIFLVTCLLLLFSGLLFLASRNTSIATFVILIFVFPLFGTNNKWRYILISVSCLLLVALIITQVPYLKERFSIELISDIKPLSGGKFISYSATEPRIDRWKGALTLISDSPVFGYGTGDEIEMLKTQYAKKGLYISYLESFNAHNEYLSILLKHGVIGLITFAALLFYYFKLALKNKNFMYFAFLALLIMGFYTENILDANKGITFFALFNTLFGYSVLKDNSHNHQNAEI